MTLGQFIKNWRMNVLRLSMREFCIGNNISSSRWMVIERDLAKPASLEALAKVLAIDEKMDAYRHLQSLYFAHEPRALSEQEMNGMMPALCRLGDKAWVGLRNELQSQMHIAIAGTHPI